MPLNRIFCADLELIFTLNMESLSFVSVISLLRDKANMMPTIRFKLERFKG